MKCPGKIFAFILLMVAGVIPFSTAQVVPVATEQQLENQTLVEETETEDDAWLQDMEQFRKNPININRADANELNQLRTLTALQIASLLSYRNLLGPIVHVYELQAIPSWDPGTIRKILPFITIESPLTIKSETGKRFREGDHSLLLRISQVLEKAKGFTNDSGGTKYRGTPLRIFFRYRYSYKNVLQFGLLGEKDAGEQFFRGMQNKGFDFYSFHLFARKWGAVEALALGDFTVNMGQGLIQWQSLAFKKSTDVLNTRRQSAVLRPYGSSGEFNFHRGAGITVRKGMMTITGFISLRKLSANTLLDSAVNRRYVSSFVTSGYHRTESEIADRNKLSQTAFGTTVLVHAAGWHFAVNGIHYSFSLPVQKRPEPYNLYALSGKTWLNISVDYSYTYRNLHFFGEAATDKNLDKAFINGLLICVAPQVDFSVVQRSIHKAYQSVNGNAFTEQAYPSNENGWYAGISIRPAVPWRLDAYADFFQFPWLKFLADAPSRGTDFMVQAEYTPNKQLSVYTRFRNETKQVNQPGISTVTNFLVSLSRMSWRTHLSWRLSPALHFGKRMELLWFGNKESPREQGFLGLVDLLYQPPLKAFSGTLRLQYFETEGYASRIYTYEKDVLYSLSIPVFYDRGFRYYLNINYEPSKKIRFWLRWAQTVFSERTSIGSGPEEIHGHQKTEIRLQSIWTF